MTGKRTSSYRLITNLGTATIVRGGQPVRTHVNAILLRDDEPRSESEARRPQRIVGFGPDFTWSVFDFEFGCGRLEYETASYESPELFFSSPYRPMFHEAILRWADGTVITLLACDDERPIDVVDVPWREVNEVLTVKVASYWMAPNMPTLEWQPADSVRHHLGVPNPRG